MGYSFGGVCYDTLAHAAVASTQDPHIPSVFYPSSSVRVTYGVSCSVLTTVESNPSYAVVSCGYYPATQSLSSSGDVLSTYVNPGFYRQSTYYFPSCDSSDPGSEVAAINSLFGPVLAALVAVWGVKWVYRTFVEYSRRSAAGGSDE